MSCEFVLAVIACYSRLSLNILHSFTHHILDHIQDCEHKCLCSLFW